MRRALLTCVAVVGGAPLLLLTVPIHTLLAVRRVYRLSWPWAVTATAVLAAVFVGLLLVYRGMLFFTTYYSL